MRALRQRITLEIRGLYPITEEKHLVGDLAGELKVDPGDIEETTKGAVTIREGDKIRMGYLRVTLCVMPNVLRCFKCHHLGHVSYNCPAKLKDKEICCRCGSLDHGMAECTAQARCLLCVEAKRPEDRVRHIDGSTQCPIYKEAVRITVSRSCR